ncbi:hypothetical protein ACLMAB_05655 [Brevibacillus laterosporus]
MLIQTVYKVSGPAGVGKSTTSSALVNALNSAYISGDDVSHMHVSGRQMPWESKSELSLIWNNILSLTQNFVLNGVSSMLASLGTGRLGVIKHQLLCQVLIGSSYIGLGIKLDDALTIKVGFPDFDGKWDLNVEETEGFPVIHFH